MPHTHRPHRCSKNSFCHYLRHQPKCEEEVVASGTSAAALPSVVIPPVPSSVRSFEQQVQELQQQLQTCDMERQDNEQWMVHYFKKSVFDVLKQVHEKRKLEREIDLLRVKVVELEGKVEELKQEVNKWEQEYDRVELEVDQKTVLGMQYLQEKNEKDQEIFRLRGVLAEAERNLGLFTSYRNSNPFQ